MPSRKGYNVNKPDLGFYHSTIEARVGQERAAVEDLASWLLKYSAMFDYDNASIKDARLIAEELLNMAPNPAEIVQLPWRRLKDGTTISDPRSST